MIKDVEDPSPKSTNFETLETTGQVTSTKFDPSLFSRIRFNLGALDRNEKLASRSFYRFLVPGNSASMLLIYDRKLPEDPVAFQTLVHETLSKRSLRCVINLKTGNVFIGISGFNMSDLHGDLYAIERISRDNPPEVIQVRDYFGDRQVVITSILSSAGHFVLDNNSEIIPPETRRLFKTLNIYCRDEVPEESYETEHRAVNRLKVLNLDLPTYKESIQKWTLTSQNFLPEDWGASVFMVSAFLLETPLEESQTRLLHEHEKGIINPLLKGTLDMGSRVQLTVLRKRDTRGKEQYLAIMGGGHIDTKVLYDEMTIKNPEFFEGLELIAQFSGSLDLDEEFNISGTYKFFLQRPKVPLSLTLLEPLDLGSSLLKIKHSGAKPEELISIIKVVNQGSHQLVADTGVSCTIKLAY